MDETKSPQGPEAAPPAALVTSVPGGLAPDEPQVQGIDRLHVLYKHRKLVTLAALLGLAAGVVQTYTTPTSYMATAIVRADPDTPPLIATNPAAAGGTDTESFVRSEMSVILGRDLKRRVVRKLKLDQNPQLATLLRPSALGGASAVLRSSIVRAIRRTTDTPLESASGQPGAGAVGASRPAADPLETAAEARAIELVAANLQVRPQPASRVFTIALSSASPQVSADIANAFASEYAGENPTRRRQRIQDQLKSLREALVDLNAQLEAERQTLDHAGQGATMVDTDVVARNVSAAEVDLHRKQSARAAAERKARDMAALDPERHLEAAQTYPDVLESTASARQQVATLRSDRLRVINQGGRPDSALINAIDTQVARLQQDLTAEVRRRIDLSQRDYAAALSDERTADRILEAQQNLRLRNSRAAISLDALRKDVGLHITRRDDLLAQQKALEQAATGTATNIAIIEYARPPQNPYQPNTPRNVLVSLAIGLSIGLVLAFGLDRLDDTIKTPEDITRKLHVPFLGLVPAVRGDRQPVLSGPVPHDFGEAYRALRTSLVFTSGAETTRIIIVTSAQPLEG
jgi:succinoglycan biosynthesis transport protein ExoP